MTQLLTNVSAIVVAIGILAFIISVIVQVVKNITLFKKVPTDLLVFVLAIVLTIGAYFAYISYAAIAFVWYMFIAAILIGFIVALVAMQGWAKVVAIGKRYIKTDLQDALSDTTTDTTTKEVEQ